MGSTFYILGFLLALLFFTLGARRWFLKNKDAIEKHLLEWVCYQNASARGYIRPGEYEADRLALDYAIKHNKRTTWQVFN